MRRPIDVTVTALLGLAVAVTGCASGPRLSAAVDGTVPPTQPPTTVTQPACPADQLDLDATRSYPPMSPLPAPGVAVPGSSMAAIQQRGRLVVGVSGDTLLFGARNPQTGRLEGFDIDVLREVAKQLFGADDSTVDSYLEFQVIPYRDRLPRLESRQVDVVAHTMTINCVRWQRIAFSEVYFLAGQRVLVPADSPYDSLDGLAAAGAIVCVPDGSTNLELLQTYVSKGVLVDRPADISDCLVHLQEGKAAAITGDDTVLAGLAAQDRNLKMVGALLTSEPYGLGFNLADVDFVRYVNAILDVMRTDGRWEALHTKWLGDPGIPPVPTKPYRDLP